MTPDYVFVFASFFLILKKQKQKKSLSKITNFLKKQKEKKSKNNKFGRKFLCHK